MKRHLLVIAIALLYFGARGQSGSKGGQSGQKDGAIGTITGHLQDPALDEVSGIAASYLHPGIYYVHNDSGDSSRFFAITADGVRHATYHFQGDTHMRLGVLDCEDIAVGPGSQPNASYIYLGDIGDNKAVRTYIAVYRIREPALMASNDSEVQADALHIRYPDGARDAETLMVDPIDRLLYIISKREDSVHIYSTPLDFRTGDTVTLRLRGTLHVPGIPPLNWITAGDISHDGTRILVKNYMNVYYWSRSKDQPVWKALSHAPVSLPYTAERQGEAIGFLPNGKGYCTTSEGRYAPLYFYPLH